MTILWQLRIDIHLAPLGPELYTIAVARWPMMRQSTALNQDPKCVGFYVLQIALVICQ